MGALRQSVAGRTRTTSSVSFGLRDEQRLVLKHRFLVFHCTSTTCFSTPVRPTEATTGQRPPMAALRSLVVAARFLSDNVMAASYSADSRVFVLFVLSRQSCEAREAPLLYSGCLLLSVKGCRINANSQRDLPSVNEPPPFCAGSVSFTIPPL